MPRDKGRYRDRRSSSGSSVSSHERKKSRSKYKRRSRSRDHSESSSHRRRRSVSRSRHKRKSHSRSLSRDRYEKSRRRSSSKSRSKRDQSHSRSSSRSRSKYSKSKKSHKRHSSSSRSSSFDIGNRIPSTDSEDLGSILDSLMKLNLKSNIRTPLLSKRPIPSKKINLDDTESKVEKAIKAAEAAGLTMTKIPTYEYKEVEIKEDMPTIHDRNLLLELNSDSFVQKPFMSSRSKKESKNIVIDLNAQTVKVPESEIKPKDDDTIINFDEIPSEEDLKEMWIKKLYQYRKRMLKGEI